MARKADGSVREWLSPIVAIPRYSIGFLFVADECGPLREVLVGGRLLWTVRSFFREQFDGLN